jgi:hypothetical protein
MTNKYRVLVEEITSDDDGDEFYSTIVELTAPAAVLATFAPNVVAQALDAGNGTPHERPNEPSRSPADATLPESPNGTTETTKRRRRTKAEIAADEAAKAAANAMPAAEQELHPAPPAEAPATMPPAPPAVPYDPFR